VRYYAELLKLGCFTVSNVASLTGSAVAAEKLLGEYRKRGWVAHVRRGLWVALGLDDGQPVVSRYRIGSAVTASGCVSHHSALEYLGYANQVFYEVYVSAGGRFEPFAFDGVSYRHVAARIDAGVVRGRDGVLVTDAERTVLDSANDATKIGGWEELRACLRLVPRLDSEKLTQYLGLYGKRAMWQKAGWLLSPFADPLDLPAEFFDECEARAGRAVTHLDPAVPAGQRVWDARWRLLVPEDLAGYSLEGV
jgi:predicted transcriptional regulator of viral defense system